MADEPEKTRRAAVADRLKAMFKAAEKLPIPPRVRGAAEPPASDEDEAPAPAKSRGGQP